MAVVQREVRRRGFFGHVFKLAFILFNILMAAWLVSYWVAVSETLQSAQSEAERAGGAIGTAMGTGMLVFFWVAGSVILGLITLLTRGQRILVTEEK